MLIRLQFNLTERYTARALLALSTTLPAALVSLVTVIFVHILNHSGSDMDTIQTWTCKYKNSHPVEQTSVDLPSGMGNGDFKSLCSESVSLPLILGSHVLL